MSLDWVVHVCLRHSLKGSNRLSTLENVYANNRHDQHNTDSSFQIPNNCFSTCLKTLFLVSENSGDFIFGDFSCLRSLLSPCSSSLPRPESVTSLSSLFGVWGVICHLGNVLGVSE